MNNPGSLQDRLTRIDCDYRAIVQNPNPLIPPIFCTDKFGRCSEWNLAMTRISGWSRSEIVGRMLLERVFGLNDNACCRLRNEAAMINLRTFIIGRGTDRTTFGFYSKNGEKYVVCMLYLTRKVDRKGYGYGVCCFLQLTNQELQQTRHVHRLSEKTAAKTLQALNYMRRQVRNPLHGIMLCRELLLGTELSEEQRKFLHRSANCLKQLDKVLDDTDLDGIIDGYLQLEMMEFKLHEVLVASISQVMMKCNSKGIQTVNGLPEDVMAETLYGDRLRLQQILADFLSVTVNCTPNGGGLFIAVGLTKVRLGESSLHLANVEFRITHVGEGVPEDLLNQIMHGSNSETTEEGISLLISRKLLKLMNGDVKYIRQPNSSVLTISVQLAILSKPISKK